MHKRICLFVALAIAASAVDLSAQRSRLTVLHGVAGLSASVDVFVGTSRAFGFDYLDIEGPLDLAATSHSISIRQNGQTLASRTVSLQASRNYSLIAHRTASGTIQLALFENNVSTIPSGSSRFTIRHAAQGAPIDVALARNGSTVTTFGNLANQGQSSTLVPTDVYTNTVFDAGASIVRFGPASIHLREDVHHVVYAVGDLGGASFRLLEHTIDLSPSYRLFNGGTACNGWITSNVPTAQVGTAFDVNLYRATPNSPAVMLFGDSSTGINGTPLPLDLGFVGAPGCSLYTNAVMALPIVTNPIGLTSVRVTLPPGVGAYLTEGYFQFAFPSNNNSFGFEFTAFLGLIAN